MTTSFVADASVAIGWVHPGQASSDTEAMLETVAAGAVIEVPALWALEVANALIVLERRKKLTGDERKTALHWLRGLPVRVDHEAAGMAFTLLADLATTHSLSIYDAVYLELAMRRKLSLACADGPLRSAARRVRVGVWRPTRA